MAEVIDSLEPIIIHAKNGKWSEYVLISPSRNITVNFNISYSGSVRVEKDDYTIVDLDGKGKNNDIGDVPSNRLVHFTSLTPNTEEVVIRRWVKRRQV
jgi:hypothetical protein